MQQVALDRLILPIHDHGLGFVAIHRQIENGVVAGFRIQNARNHARVYADGKRVFARSIHDRRNLSLPAHAPCIILRPSFSRLRFQYVRFQCSRHNEMSYLLYEVFVSSER